MFGEKYSVIFRNPERYLRISTSLYFVGRPITHYVCQKNSRMDIKGGQLQPNS